MHCGDAESANTQVEIHVVTGLNGAAADTRPFQKSHDKAMLLWLIRESATAVEKTATNGMYQHNMQKHVQCRLLRVTLADDSPLYPEISGSQHRFIVRFLEWSSIGSRAVQTGDDVNFYLSVC